MIELATTNDFMTEAPWYPILFLGIVCVVEIFALSLCLIFLIKKPDRNSLFGYRTKLTLASDEIWEWVNKRIMIIMLVTMIMLIITNVILGVGVYKLDWNWFFSIIISVVLLIGILLLEVIFMEVWTSIKWRNFKVEPVKPLIENDQSLKQDIDEFWS